MAKKTLNHVAYDAARQYEIRLNPDAAEEWPPWEEIDDPQVKAHYSAIVSAVTKRDRERR